MRYFFGFGHSHWNAIRLADEERAARGLNDWKVLGLDMGSARYQPWITFPGGKPVFNETFVQDNVRGITDFKPDLIFSVIDGADYIAYALAGNPQPFDFVLPGSPDLPLNPDAHIIPYDLICSIFQPNLNHAFGLLGEIHNLTGLQIYHFSPPPPVGNEAHIRAHPVVDVLRKKLEEFGVAPSLLRYKLWVAFTGLIRQICAQNSAIFINVPPSSADQEGFMRDEFCALDPVHGNAAYGELVIQQMISLTTSSINA